MSKRAVLYARVSTDEQAQQGYGLQGQLAECRTYAERLGFEIVKEYAEDYTGFSAFDDRPAGKDVMAILKAKQADAVIAHRVDRIARDSLEARIAARTWLKGGIEVHTVKNGRIENDNSIVFLIETWQGQEDYTKIVDNLKRGRSFKAKSGKVVGCNRAPYGYRFLRDERGKVMGLEVDDATARIVKLIFTWYVFGDESGKPLTLWAIGNKLTAMQIPTPGELRGVDKVTVHHRTKKVLTMRRGVWNALSVSHILNRETYAGTWRYGQRIGTNGAGGLRPLAEQIAVAVPAVIDRETWERAQAQRKYNAAMSKRNSKHEYLLSGIIECSCGRSLSGYSNPGGTRGYRCVSIGYSNRREICHEKAINADRLEPIVWNSIKQKFENLDALWVELKAAQQEELTAQDPRRAELQTVETWIAEAEQEAGEIGMALRKARGRVGEGLEVQQDQVNARLDGLNERRGKLIAELGARRLTDDAIATVMQYAKDVRAGIDNATFDDKRKAFKSLGIRVKVKGGEIDAVTGVISFCIFRRACGALRR